MLSDTIVTIRNDRFVIPVKQEYRSSYGGIVHDTSSSGATLFIEPQAIVDMNNSLQQAKVKEKQEIERILRMLTEHTAEHTQEIAQNVEVLQTLDFIFAKARYAKAMKATKPLMNGDGFIRLKKRAIRCRPKIKSWPTILNWAEITQRSLSRDRIRAVKPLR